MLQSRVLFSFHFYSISFHVLYFISYPLSHYIPCISFHVLYLISCTVFYFMSCLSFQYFTSYHVHLFHVLYSVSRKVFQFMYCHTFHGLYLMSCQCRMVNMYGIYILLIISFISFSRSEPFSSFIHKQKFFSDESKNTYPRFQSIRVVCILQFSVKSFSFQSLFKKVVNMYLSNFVQSLLSELEEPQLAIYNITDACFIFMLSLVGIALSLMFCTHSHIRDVPRSASPGHVCVCHRVVVIDQLFL